MRINYNNLLPHCLMYSRCFLAQYICPRLNTFYAFSKYCVLAIFLCICHAQTVNAQTIVGPCGSSITITNASSPTATDGKYVVSGLTADAVYVRLGIVGSEMIFEAFNVTNTSCVASGLGVGTYTVRIYTETGGIATCANVTQLVTIGSTSLAACAGTEIGGTVFHDANANGINDVGEQGQAGITINAYNSAGTLAATQTSATNGVYRFTGLTTGQPYRLEYAWGDGYLKSGAAGTGSGTSIQFVNAGSCVANFGVNFPPNYCQTNNPYVMTPCYINGDPTASAVAPLDVMVAFPYRAASFDFGLTNRNVAPTHVASASQMGATWAVAYQKTSKYAFAGATMRRFAGFGPLGTGGIYKINMTIPTAPVVSNWIDAKVIGIPTGNDTRNATVVNRLATAPGTPAYDAEAFNQVGKVGIGGMDFNERGDTLWLVNLADKRLYGIKNVNPATTPVAADLIAGQAISLPAGYSYVTNANDFRPWAVKYYKGLVYVGAVCSAESTPWNSANLKGYVLSFNPANPAAGFSVVAEYPLNIVRQGYSTSLGSNYPWVANTTTPNYATQPMALDIEFDVDGSMIVSMGDRGGFQSGNQNYAADPTATNTTLYEGGTMGDIFRFCKAGATFAFQGTAGCPFPTANPFPFQEYYWGDGGPNTSTSISFNETSAGGLATLAGSGTVLMTAQDPYEYYAGGVISLSNVSGGDRWRYNVYDGTAPGASGKAAGLGDLETLCDPAPIEIGNRVWVDVDNDGLQDANEVGLPNITLDLYRAGVLVTSTTTDANGNYKFTNLLPNTAYEIRVVLTQTNINGRPLGNANAGANDFIDSDMTGSGTGVIALTTGYYGENNHSYDIAFRCNTSVTAVGSAACVGGTATLTATGNSAGGSYSWSGPNSYVSAAQNPTIVGIPLLNAGTYTVTFTASDRCPATATANITVNPVVSITAQPTGFTECVGGILTLTAAATGGYAPLTYQWEQSTNGGSTWSAISGATTTTHTPNSAATGSIQYRIVVSSSGGLGCNPATSNAVTVVIVADPVVTITVPSTTICTGGNITLTANPVGGVGTCTTQWQSSPTALSSWTNIGGATSNTFNTTLSSGLKYRAQLSCTGSGCCN
jgi:SdrD B-like domain